VTVSHTAEDRVLGGERQSDGLWTHRGKLVVRSALELQPPAAPAGGLASLVLPAGSVTTAMLAPNAASAMIGSYFAVPTWSTTTTSSWIGTIVSTGSIACSGALLRIEFSGTLTHSVLGGGFYSGLMIDGNAVYTLSISNSPGVNYGVPIAWVVYYTPTVGNHIFQMMVNNASAGTLQVSSNVNTGLYVTEQRR
jgi:hypothetical protein